jgi:hypothetical protein
MPRPRLLDDGETKVIKIDESFSYRGASFESGRFYRVEDKPEGFIAHHVVSNRTGHVVEDQAELEGAEILDDPRPAAVEAAAKARDEETSRRAAENANRENRIAENVAHSADGKARVFTSFDNLFGGTRMAAASEQTLQEGVGGSGIDSDLKPASAVAAEAVGMDPSAAAGADVPAEATEGTEDTTEASDGDDSPNKTAINPEPTDEGEAVGTDVVSGSNAGELPDEDADADADEGTRRSRRRRH